MPHGLVITGYGDEFVEEFRNRLGESVAIAHEHEMIGHFGAGGEGPAWEVEQLGEGMEFAMTFNAEAHYRPGQYTGGNSEIAETREIPYKVGFVLEEGRSAVDRSAHPGVDWWVEWNGDILESARDADGEMKADATYLSEAIGDALVDRLREAVMEMARADGNHIHANAMQVPKTLMS